jgi:hypothetical protein
MSTAAPYRLYFRAELGVLVRCVVDIVLREDLHTASLFGTQQCNDAVTFIELRSDVVQAAEATGAAFELGLQGAKTWCTRARAALAEIQVKWHRQCVLDMCKLAMKVEKHTPKLVRS